jgi:phospholipase D1/2
MNQTIYQFQIFFNQQTHEIRRRLHDYIKMINKIQVETKIKIKFSQKQLLQNESQLNFSHVQELICSQIEQLVSQGLGCSVSLQEFLEISAQSYEENSKFKELWVSKQAGGRYTENCKFCRTWHKVYLHVTNDGIYYRKCKPACLISEPLGRNDQVSSTLIREYLIYDRNFIFQFGKETVGRKKDIVLTSFSRLLRIRVSSIFKLVDLIYCIKSSYQRSACFLINRFTSFSPARDGNFCESIIDGSNYFQKLFECLNKAKKEIFITDWWLQPELMLIRPSSYACQQDVRKYRLDNVLLRLASERNVRISILLYAAPKMFFAWDSEAIANYLMQLHDNIKVITHPKNVLPIF